jgi:hypothetical protein
LVYRISPLFLLVYERTTGAVNQRLIESVESFLIDIAKDSNPELVNRHGTNRPQFHIPGVYRSPSG